MNAKGYAPRQVLTLPDDSPVAKTTKARPTVRPALPDAHADVALGDLKDVCSIIRMGPSWVHAEVAAGRFPQPLRWGPRCTRWPISVVRNWLLERMALAEADTEAASFVKMRAAKASAAAKVKRAAIAASAGAPQLNTEPNSRSAMLGSGSPDLVPGDDRGRERVSAEVLEPVTAPTKMASAVVRKPEAVAKARAKRPAKKAMLADSPVLRASHGMEGPRG